MEALEEMEMAIPTWVLLLLVVSLAAGRFAGLSSVIGDIARGLLDAFLIIFVVLLVLGFTDYRPA
jgi:uncharacterized membrane protein YtjA (UPF0391 family)